MLGWDDDKLNFNEVDLAEEEDDPKLQELLEYEHEPVRDVDFPRRTQEEEMIIWKDIRQRQVRSLLDTANRYELQYWSEAISTVTEKMRHADSFGSLDLEERIKTDNTLSCYHQKYTPFEIKTVSRLLPVSSKTKKRKRTYKGTTSYKVRNQIASK